MAIERRQKRYHCIFYTWWWSPILNLWRKYIQMVQTGVLVTILKCWRACLPCNQYRESHVFPCSELWAKTSPARYRAKGCGNLFISRLFCTTLDSRNMLRKLQSGSVESSSLPHVFPRAGKYFRFLALRPLARKRSIANQINFHALFVLDKCRRVLEELHLDPRYIWGGCTQHPNHSFSFQSTQKWQK